jgi:hypothetical protein
MQKHQAKQEATPIEAKVCHDRKVTALLRSGKLAQGRFSLRLPPGKRQSFAACWPRLAKPAIRNCPSLESVLHRIVESPGKY